MSRFGRFELIEPLGSGGVAEVWRARDASAPADVALKRLLPQFADDRQVRRRFLREAEVASRLDHPNIVHVLASGEEEGRPFLAMELVAGEDLGRGLERRGRLPPNESWKVAVGVARALAHAHARGIVHRDVKPQNVLVDGDTIKLTDFGLARVETLASLTGSSLLWGSPEYMAPELFGRGRLDPRADLFSLGVLICEMVTGRLPWKEGRSPARIAAGAASPPISVTLGFGPALDRLVSSMLSASPDDRPSSADEVLAVLEGRQSPAPLVEAATCAACGQPRPADVPRCFSCGHEEIPLRHLTAGRWNVVLDKVTEDAESMDTLHRLLAELTGRRDLRLKFVVGQSKLYSKEEQESAIKLPAVLFSDLDEPAAKEIERRLRGAGFGAQAARRRWWGLGTRRQAKAAGAVGGVVVGWSLISQLLIRTHVPGAFPLLILTLAMGGLATLIGVGASARALARQRGRFRLREAPASTPQAGRLLDAARGAAGGLATPEVRALYIDVSRALYRLTRRVEELEGRSSRGSSEAALARRLLAATPAFAARLDGLARRLETLDAALDGDGEGDFARELAALERRLAGASEADRPPLEAALRDVEGALERRLATETERERLAAALCRLLTAVRDAYHRAASLRSVEERAAAAIEAALGELDTPYVPS